RAAVGPLAEYTLQLRPDIVQRVVPGVTLVGNVRLKNSQRHRFSAVTPVLDVPSDGRHLDGGRLFGQNPPDLQVRVDSLIRSAKQLEDQLVAVDHRRVSLLAGARRGLDVRGGTAPGPAENFGRRSGDLPGGSLQTPPLGN